MTTAPPAPTDDLQALVPDVVDTVCRWLDALSVLMRLQERGAGRVADGGAPIEVRTVEGANLRPDVAVCAQPVIEAGRVELLPFVHAQAIGITAHRLGSPDPLAHQVLRETP